MSGEVVVEDVYDILTSMGQEHSSTARQLNRASTETNAARVNGINNRGAEIVPADDQAVNNTAGKGVARKGYTSDLTMAASKGAPAQVRGQTFDSDIVSLLHCMMIPR